MTVDYYSLLMKAVAGKDAVARDQVYKDAFGLIARSHITRSCGHLLRLSDSATLESSTTSTQSRRTA